MSHLMPQRQRDNDYYFQFILDLDDPRIDLTEWEVEFVEKMLHYFPEVLSDKQKAVIQAMAQRYLGEDVEI